MSSTLSNSRSGVAMDAAEPSIYINYVYENITRERIIETFTEVFAGEYIERVDMVRKTNTETEEEYFSVFIHLTSWPTGQAFQNIRQKLIDGKDFKLVYDSPWFWKCCASKMPKPSNKPKVRLSPFISCDDDEDKPAARSVVVKAKPARRTNVVAEAKPDETKTKTKTKIIKTKTKKTEDDAEVVASVAVPVADAKKTKAIRKDGAGAGAVAIADAKRIAAKTKTTKKVVVLEQSTRSVSRNDETPKYAVRTAVVDAASVTSDTYLLAYNSIGAPRVDSIAESHADSTAESSSKNNSSDGESNDSESNDDESS
jgi:hypothetical protein